MEANMVDEYRKLSQTRLAALDRLEKAHDFRSRQSATAEAGMLRVQMCDVALKICNQLLTTQDEQTAFITKGS